MSFSLFNWYPTQSEEQAKILYLNQYSGHLTNQLVARDMMLANHRSQLEAQQSLIATLQEQLAEQMAKVSDLERRVQLSEEILENQEKTRIAIFHRPDAEEAKELLKEIRLQTKKSRKIMAHNQKRSQKPSQKPSQENPIEKSKKPRKVQEKEHKVRPITLADWI